MLTPGTRLGPYEVVSSLGAGGMGAVYRAHDSRLGRDVAIKILPDLFASDPDRLQRFEREARTLAALNHPNIAAIFGIEEAQRALVMELVPGEDLSQRIARGALPLDEALEIARQTATALEAAHEQGIVHRDLKPANIRVRPDGTVKVLDFGLAKALAPDGSSSSADAMNSPTLTAHATHAGLIVGTAAYMAPEQARGKAVDRRADIWAFGVVLFEMLTGARAFPGDDVSEILATVLKTDPDWGALPAGTPTSVRRLLRRCLEKDPRKRLSAIGDARLELDEAEAPSPRPTGDGMPLAAGLLTAAVLVTALATWWLTRAPAAPAQVIRADLVLPPGISYLPSTSRNMALSPDGSRLVFSGVERDESRLVVRELRGTTTILLSGEIAIMPFVSPDGQWVAYGSTTHLMKVAMSGGAAIPISNVHGVFGAVWMPDDTIVFASPVTRGLMRVPAGGGTPQPLTAPQDGETDHRWPAALPGGGAILYAAASSTSWSDAVIVMQPLDGGERRIVLRGGTSPQYAGGQLVFARAGALYAVPFDAEQGAVTGTPQQIVNAIETNEPDGRAHYTLSANGTLVYLAGSNAPPQRALAWIDRSGRLEHLPVAARAFEHPRISPDERHLAVTVREANTDVWSVDLDRHTVSRMTSDPGEEESPIWTPDSRFITFSATRAGQPRQALRKSIDGSGDEELLLTTPRHQHLVSWTPDGSTLISEEIDANWRLYSAARGVDATPLTPNAYSSQSAQLSPDGRWLVYASNEGGTSEIYVHAFPGPGPKLQISSGGGTEPRWSPRGDELFFRSGNRMMRVGIRPEPALSATRPQVLFEVPIARMAWPQANYDVARDGKRFLVILGSDPPMPTSLQLVTNWVHELSSRTLR